MPKMMTDEPSVILKLKKGGHVAKKEHHKEEHGHKSMHHMMDGGIMNALASAPRGPMPPMAGMAPKRPPMAMRRKAMAAMPTPLMKKGGKTHHHAKGGEVESPKEHKAEMHEMHKIEKELKHHESMKAGKAHHGLKAGGKVHHISGHPEGSHEHHKHMAKHHAKMHKEGGSAHHKKMCEHHKEMCKGGHYASGGAIDADMTKTTLKNSVKPFVSRADTSRPDHSPAHTGEIKKSNAGGYKRGGRMTGDETPMYRTKEYNKGGRATGSSIPSETNESETRGKIKIGGTIEDNEHYYENTDLHSARPFSGSKSTGGVSMSNAGGFKHGGKAKMHHKADGGAIDKYDTRNTVEGGNWENRPANSTPKGKSHTTTGIVKLANAGGYKHGGKTTKKAYATGGNVNDMGKAVKMPLRIKHPPVANTLQSGTYKRGGNVHRFSEGDSVGSMKKQPKEPEYTTEQLNRAYQDHYDREKAENLADSKMVDDALMYVPRKVMQGVDYLKEKIRGTPSVPARRRGGSMKR